MNIKFNDNKIKHMTARAALIKYSKKYNFWVPNVFLKSDGMWLPDDFTIRFIPEKQNIIDYEYEEEAIDVDWEEHGFKVIQTESYLKVKKPQKIEKEAEVLDELLND